MCLFEKIFIGFGGGAEGGLGGRVGVVGGEMRGGSVVGM